jgi:hypothetical protein
VKFGIWLFSRKSTTEFQEGYAADTLIILGQKKKINSRVIKRLKAMEFFLKLR